MWCLTTVKPPCLTLDPNISHSDASIKPYHGEWVEGVGKKDDEVALVIFSQRIRDHSTLHLRMIAKMNEDKGLAATAGR